MAIHPKPPWWFVSRAPILHSQHAYQNCPDRVWNFDRHTDHSFHYLALCVFPFCPGRREAEGDEEWTWAEIDTATSRLKPTQYRMKWIQWMKWATYAGRHEPPRCRGIKQSTNSDWLPSIGPNRRPDVAHSHWLPWSNFPDYQKHHWPLSPSLPPESPVIFQLFRFKPVDMARTQRKFHLMK